MGQHPKSDESSQYPSLRGEGAPRATRRSDSERALWQEFLQAGNVQDFCRSWLPIQCRTLPRVQCAMVLLGPPEEGPFTPAAIWPHDRHDVTHLAGTAQRSLRERRGLVVDSSPSTGPDESSPEGYQVAYPIEISGRLHGVVVLAVDPFPKERLQAILRQLHWGAAGLEVMVRRAEAAESAEVNRRLQSVLDLVASVAESERFQAAAMGLVTRFATMFECERVSLGFIDGNQVRVSVLSHSAEFGKKTNLMRAIGSAMDEALDQHAVVTYPAREDSALLVTRKHEELARQHGTGEILTIPLESEGRILGGICLERLSGRPFDETTREICEAAAAIVGPIIETKRRDDRWLPQKVRESIALQVNRLLGSGFLTRKVVLGTLAAVVIFFCVARVDYRVTGPTSIEGAIQRVIAAPFNGYVRDASVRPGDVVGKGDLLCLLDDRDLQLEYLKWSSEKKQLVKQYHENMAMRNRAQIRITDAKIEQADAQMSLIQDQLARTRVVAPFEGVVVSGDLSQSLGAPVERGQVLFEIAPLDAYRVIVDVDERDIAEIAVGQTGEMILSSMSGRVHGFSVEKITPVTTAKEGRNYFQVEGSMLEAPEGLRQGMEGIGKIQVGRRMLIWAWTHTAIDWLRLKLWTWWP